MIKQLDKGTLGYIFAFVPFSSSVDKIESINFYLSNYTTNELLNIQISKVKYDNIPQLMMKVQLNDSFSIIDVSLTLGLQNIHIAFTIPLLITKFLEPFETSIENYASLSYEYTHTSNNIYTKMDDAVIYNPMTHSGKNIIEFLKKLNLSM